MPKQLYWSVRKSTIRSASISRYAAAFRWRPEGKRKRTQTLLRPLLPFLMLSLLLSLSQGCRKKAVAPPPATTIETEPASPSNPAPTAITPAPSSVPSKPASEEPAPILKVTTAPNSLDLGIKSFRAGDFGNAVQLFEDYLQAGSNTENRDVALFHLFLSRRLAGNSAKNTRRAEDALKRLVTEFPNSPYRDSAEFILGLETQIESLKSDNREKEAKIKQLSDELQKLKEIDLQRRPSRPNY